MPIVAASNGIRPEIRALAVIELNKPVTPQEINDCVGTGDYAAKYISFLRNRYGFTFTVQKDGRAVLSYTCVGEPANVADLRSQKPKVKGAKPAKSKVAKSTKTKTAKTVATKTKTKTAEQIKAANLEKMKKVSAKIAKQKTKKVVDVVEAELGSTGEITSSYNVDPAWDSAEGLDIKRLVA